MNLNFSKKDIEEAVKSVCRGKQHLVFYNEYPAFDSLESIPDYEANKEIEKDENALGKFCNKKVVRENITKLVNKIKQGSYSPSPYSGVAIKRAGKSPRTLLVPSPEDRIVFKVAQKKLKEKIQPIINAYNVFGSGGRDDLTTNRDILEDIAKESLDYKYALKVDVKNYFPSIVKEKISRALATIINDQPDLLELLKLSFNNKIHITQGSKEYAQHFPDSKSEKGIPQGCSFSPLLANFYGLPIDAELKKRGNCKSYRYLDDIIILVQDREMAGRTFKSIERMGERLNLEFHPFPTNGKSYICPTDRKFEYLGVDIRNGELFLPEDKKKAFIHEVKSSRFNTGTLRDHGFTDSLKVTELYVVGWNQYYGKLGIKNWEEEKKEINKELEDYYLGKCKENGIETTSNILHSHDIFLS